MLPPKHARVRMSLDGSCVIHGKQKCESDEQRVFKKRVCVCVVHVCVHSPPKLQMKNVHNPRPNSSFSSPNTCKSTHTHRMLFKAFAVRDASIDLEPGLHTASLGWCAQIAAIDQWMYVRP